MSMDQFKELITTIKLEWLESLLVAFAEQLQENRFRIAEHKPCSKFKTPVSEAMKPLVVSKNMLNMLFRILN